MRASSGRLFAVTALTLAALCGCGPGVGGTGTGTPIGPADFGAQAQSVCASPLSSALGCESPTSSGEPEVVVFTGDGAGAIARLQFANNEVTLLARCQGLEFEGTWGAVGSQPGRYFGGAVFAGAPDLVPAILEVTLAGPPGSPEADKIVITLVDANGAVLVGPTTLTRVEDPNLPKDGKCD